MKTKAITFIATVLALGCVGTAAMAAAGLPDPSSNDNTIPVPSADQPSDPSAADNPAARVPTTENGFEIRSEGYGIGTSGQGYDQYQSED